MYSMNYAIVIDRVIQDLKLEKRIRYLNKKFAVFISGQIFEMIILDYSKTVSDEFNFTRITTLHNSLGNNAETRSRSQEQSFLYISNHSIKISYLFYIIVD